MWPFTARARVEDPQRLNRFLDAIGADWQNQSREQFNRLFTALNDLTQHEIVFYYRARKRQRSLSLFTRVLALLFGSAGIMSPLLAGADPARFKSLAAYGYPLLALSAIFIVANQLFGATGGHIRYVTAQLELERALTIFRLDWAEWQAQHRSASTTDEQVTSGFAILRAFTATLYKTIQDETSVWGEAVSQALQEYARTIGSHQRIPNGYGTAVVTPRDSE